MDVKKTSAAPHPGLKPRATCLRPPGDTTTHPVGRGRRPLWAQGRRPGFQPGAVSMTHILLHQLSQSPLHAHDTVPPEVKQPFKD
jgi:hypothetical protein